MFLVSIELEFIKSYLSFSFKSICYVYINLSVRFTNKCLIIRMQYKLPDIISSTHSLKGHTQDWRFYCGQLLWLWCINSNDLWNCLRIICLVQNQFSFMPLIRSCRVLSIIYVFAAVNRYFILFCTFYRWKTGKMEKDRSFYIHLWYKFIV